MPTKLTITDASSEISEVSNGSGNEAERLSLALDEHRLSDTTRAISLHHSGSTELSDIQQIRNGIDPPDTVDERDGGFALSAKHTEAVSVVDPSVSGVMKRRTC